MDKQKKDLLVGKRKRKTAQEIQDDIFRKMPADKKIKLSCELTDLCLKLNSLNGNSKPRKNRYGLFKKTSSKAKCFRRTKKDGVKIWISLIFLKMKKIS